MSANTAISVEDGYIMFDCPNCDGSIIVKMEEINCAIFRHAVGKSGELDINPHLSKYECDMLYSSGLAYGCCKPIRLTQHDGCIVAEKCDYI